MAGRLLVENVGIQSRRKEYYGDPRNMENPSDPLPAAARVHYPEPHVAMREVTTASKNMQPRKAGGPLQITAVVSKMMDKNAEWLWQITTKILTLRTPLIVYPGS